MQSDKKKGTSGPVTIKDISSRLNISATSVHRAILGKDGVSDSLRELILATADEMGYERNYVASSIKRKTVRVAVVMPQDYGLYFEFIWRGMRDSAKEARVLNVVVDEFVCKDENHQVEILKQIADAGSKKYAGVITFCYAGIVKTVIQLTRLVSMNICTVLIDDESNEIEGVYSIPANTQIIGRVAAELGALMIPDTGTVLVSEGRTDSKILVDKLSAFVEYLRNVKPEVKVKVVSGFARKAKNDTEVYENVCRALTENPDTVLYYALTSADNRFVVQAVQDLGLQKKVRVIATDLNQESAEYLRNGEVCAVINQGAYAKGYASLSVVVDSVVKHIAPPQRIDCPIDVVLKSNLNLYEQSECL